MGYRLFLQGIFLFFVCYASAQVNVDLNIDELHQKWYFSNSRSGHNQILFYSNFKRAEEQDSNLAITEYNFSKWSNNVLYLKYNKGSIGIKGRRCPTGGPIKMTRNIVPYTSKGIWSLFQEEGFYYLEFSHYTALKGEGYQLIRTETFEIDSLDENIMVLTKLYEK